MRAYDYWWGYSSAQIDLMAVDQPLVVYPKDKDRAAKHSKKKMDDVYERWVAKKHKENSVVGEQISLTDYFKNTVKPN